MKNLASAAVVKEILSESGFRFSKSLGQNFLIDERVLDSMIDAAAIDKNTNVLEIGPGFGTLTQRLCAAAKKVVSVEIDDSVIPVLSENTAEFDNLEIVHADIMKTDIAELIKEKFGEGEKVKVAANLPYYITTPIIMMLLEGGLPIDEIVIMIQKEVAQRLAAAPGTKEYGAISVAVNFYSVPQLITKVPRSSFIPQPKVESAVIALKMRKKPAVDVSDAKRYFTVVKAAFGQRRKTLPNALANSGAFSKSKQEITELLSSLGIDANRRGETLSLDDFALIADKIYE